MWGRCESEDGGAQRDDMRRQAREAAKGLSQSLRLVTFFVLTSAAVGCGDRPRSAEPATIDVSVPTPIATRPTDDSTGDEQAPDEPADASPATDEPTAGNDLRPVPSDLAAAGDEIRATDVSVIASQFGGRIPALPEVAGFIDDPVVTAASAEDGSGYFMSVSSRVPDDHSHIGLIVSIPSDAAREYVATGGTELFAGSGHVVMSPDATAGCEPAPEDGYDTAALTWIANDVLLTLEVSPIPECEERAPLRLDEVIELATGLLACDVIGSETATCLQIYR